MRRANGSSATARSGRPTSGASTPCWTSCRRIREGPRGRPGRRDQGFRGPTDPSTHGSAHPWRSEEDGGEFGFHGEFLEVDPTNRIRHTEIYDPGDFGGTMGEENRSRVSVTFSEDEGVTTLTTLIDFGSKEGRDEAVSTGMTDGMEVRSCRLLDALLEEERDGRSA